VSLQRKTAQRTIRRAARVRSKLLRDKPRVSVFRSLSHIYAQLIDDAQQKTIASCSSLELKDISGDKKAVAFAIGKELAKRAQEQGISVAVFDRGQYLYHGRVKSLAEGLREGGLQL